MYPVDENTVLCCERYVLCVAQLTVDVTVFGFVSAGDEAPNKPEAQRL